MVIIAIIIVIDFLIIFTFFFLMFFDYFYNRGIEIIELEIPNLEMEELRGTIISYLKKEGFKVSFEKNRIKAKKWEYGFLKSNTQFHAGYVIFDILVFEESEKTMLNGQFYLEQKTWKNYKLSRYGFIHNTIARRKGWKIKKELFRKIGFEIDEINKISKLKRSDVGEGQ